MTDDDRLAKVVRRARDALASEDGFAHRILLDFGVDGVVHVDGLRRLVSEARAEAECVVRVGLDDFIALGRGALDPAKAFLTGRLKVDGDMSVALDLSKRLRAAGA